MALVPVEEALAMLLDGAYAKPAEQVPLAEAGGRVLAEPLFALRTQPPFNSSAMDGYAVRAVDTTPGARLKIIGQAPAGKTFSGTVAEQEAVRIFTGAPVPEGADAVLIQENAKPLAGNEVEVLEPVATGRNIRRRGLDFAEGELLLEIGRGFDAAALSLAASANHPTLPVVGQPKVAIIATGDELLLPGSKPGPDQIISSNAYGVAAICADAGAEVFDLGIAADRIDAITALLHQAIGLDADIIVTLGGASVGDHDLVNQALTQAGMSLSFWKIAMRPGKPLMFGRLGAARCIGLPGNPVASLLCSHLFLAPLVARLAGRAHSQDIRDARLASDMAENDLRQDYVRAAATSDTNGGLWALPFATQDSSMLRVLADSNSVIIRAPFAPAAKVGDACQVMMLR